jgi:hypothetical protein
MYMNPGSSLQWVACFPKIIKKNYSRSPMWQVILNGLAYLCIKKDTIELIDLDTQ